MRSLIISVIAGIIIFFIISGGITPLVLSSEVVRDDNDNPDSNLRDTSEVLLEIKEELKNDPAIVRKKIRERLIELLNSPETLKIKFSKARGPQKTWFSTVEIEVRNAVFDDLNVAEAKFRFKNVKVDPVQLFRDSKLMLEPGYRVDLKITVTEEDMNAFVRKKSEKIKVTNPVVKFRENCIELTGSTKYMLAKVDFKGVGSFRIEDGNLIHFIPRKLTVNDIKMPGYALKSIIKKINPVLDMNKFPFKTELRAIKVENGRMEIISSLEDKENEEE